MLSGVLNGSVRDIDVNPECSFRDAFRGGASLR